MFVLPDPYPAIPALSRNGLGALLAALTLAAVAALRTSTRFTERFSQRKS